MATATTTKPSPSTAPASKTSLADAVAKIKAKLSPEELSQIIEESRGELPGFKVTVENDALAAGSAPVTPVSPDSTAKPPATNQPQPTAALGFFDENTPILPEGKYKFRPLSQVEMAELEANENTVRAGLPQFLAVASALLNIRKKKLWRLYARSFADYCDKRLGFSRAWAEMQADAAEVMQNLVTSGEQLLLPTAERQLRPLTGLVANIQLEAWKLALQKAAGKKVTGKQVEEAVKELVGDVAPEGDWLAKNRQQLVTNGYETDFVQPVDVGEKEWIDLLHEPSGVYVKLIDELSLSSMGISLAMREQHLDCQVIVNGASLGKKKLTAHADGRLHLLDPVLSVFMHSLDAFLERGGVLYEAGELSKDSTLELKRADGEDTATLRSALEAQKMAQPAEAEPNGDQSAEGQPAGA